MSKSEREKMKMTHFKFAFLLIPVFLLFGTRSQAQEEPRLEGLEQEEIIIKPESDSVDINTFLDELSPKGDWIKVDESSIDSEDNLEMSGTVDIDDDVYTGYVWRPRLNVYYAGWNPYSNGYWAWTFYGWIWQSYYDWGWATYHYGRWWCSPYYGWVWSPGYTWAPNWVNWCHNGNYVGWHPIRPRSPWRWHNGQIVSVPVTPKQKSITNKWTFVEKKDFTSIINPSNTIELKSNTSLISDVKMDKRGKGPSATEIGNASGQKVTQKKVTFTNQEGKKYAVELNNGQKSKTDINNNGAKVNTNTNGNRNTENNGSKNNSELNKTKENGNGSEINKNTGSKNEGNKSGNSGNKPKNEGSKNNNPNSESKQSPNRESNKSGNNAPNTETKQSPKRESNNSGNNAPRNETKQSPKRESNNSGNNAPRHETRQSPNRESHNSGNSGNNGSRNNTGSRGSSNSGNNGSRGGHRR